MVSGKIAGISEKDFPLIILEIFFWEMNQKLAESNRTMSKLLFETEEIDRTNIERKKTVRKCKTKWNSYNTKEVALELAREAKCQLMFWNQKDG